MLAARLDSANGGEIVPGIVFAFAEKSVGGFPFRLDAVLEGVTFTDRRPDGETSWRTERMAVHKLPTGTISMCSKSPGCSPSSFPANPASPRASLHHARARARERGHRRTAGWRVSTSMCGTSKPRTRARRPSRSATSRRPRAVPSAGAARRHHRRRAQGRERDDRGRLQAEAGGRARPGRSARTRSCRARRSSCSSGDAAVSPMRSNTGAQNGGMVAVERLTLDWAGIKTDLKGSLGVDGRTAWRANCTGALDAGRADGRADRRAIEAAGGRRDDSDLAALPQRRYRSGLEPQGLAVPRGERPKFGAAVSCPASTIERRIARVRVKRLNSASPSPQRTAR